MSSPFFFSSREERHDEASSQGNEGMTPPLSFQYFLCDETTNYDTNTPTYTTMNGMPYVSLMKCLIAYSEQSS